MDTSALNSAEMQRFLSQEKEKAMVTEMVAKLTNVCWDKCITSTPGTYLEPVKHTWLTIPFKQNAKNLLSPYKIQGDKLIAMVSKLGIDDCGRKFYMNRTNI